MRHCSRLCLVLAVFLLASCAKNLSIVVEIPKEEIQKKVEEKFPIKPGNGEKEKAPVEVTISDPVVVLEEGKDQIGVKVNIVAVPTISLPKLPAVPANAPEPPSGPGRGPGRGPGPGPGLGKPPLPPGGPKLDGPAALPKPRLTGTATMFAGVSYDPKTKSIHLSNPKITSLEIAQLPEKLNEPLRSMAEKALAEKLSEQAIPLETKTPIEEAVKPYLKSVTVKNGKVLVEIGW
ncbi:MAG: DUF1439 domain-containing protein [Blastocatellia bacterium]|nr:DUF1439 domain-containing protein [Blastocatellia bacterium]